MFDMGKMLKNIQVVVEDITGVCLWMMPDGTCLGDDEGNFLSMEGYLNDFLIEKKMRDAAKYWMGVEALDGHAHWLPGSRKITDNESDDHMERMLDGHIPDPVDAVRQLKEKGLA